jgi:hypothetical protein
MGRRGGVECPDRPIPSVGITEMTENSMVLFDKRKSKIEVRAVGQVPLSNFNHLTINRECRIEERFEKVQLDAISIHASKLIRCVFKCTFQSEKI